MPTNHIIIYTNFCTSSESIASKINDSLDKNDITCNTIILNGSLFKEQKFCFSKLFIGSHKLTVPDLVPNILVAMTGCASAGLDCTTVDNVIFHGFPPSIIDLAQVLGRAGHQAASGPDTDCFHIIASLDEFVNLLIHIY